MRILISEEDYSLEVVIKNETVIRKYKATPDRVRDCLLGVLKEAIGFLILPDEVQELFLQMDIALAEQKGEMLNKIINKGGDIDGKNRFKK